MLLSPPPPGIKTGSVHKDLKIDRSIFPGNRMSWMDRSTLVVKTHFFHSKAISRFDRAILLVREPFAALKVGAIVEKEGGENCSTRPTCT